MYRVKDLKTIRRVGYELERVIVVDDTAKKHERNYGNLSAFAHSKDSWTTMSFFTCLRTSKRRWGRRRTRRREAGVAAHRECENMMLKYIELNTGYSDSDSGRSRARAAGERQDVWCFAMISDGSERSRRPFTLA